MDCLEVAAELSFLKPIAGYSDIECTQRIIAFVAGDEAPDGEFRRLEAFRRTLFRLLEEGLHHEPGFESSSPPHVSLKMVAGPSASRLCGN